MDIFTAKSLGFPAKVLKYFSLQESSALEKETGLVVMER